MQTCQTCSLQDSLRRALLYEVPCSPSMRLTIHRYAAYSAVINTVRTIFSVAGPVFLPAFRSCHSPQQARFSFDKCNVQVHLTRSSVVLLPLFDKGAVLSVLLRTTIQSATVLCHSRSTLPLLVFFSDLRSPVTSFAGRRPSLIILESHTFACCADRP